MLKNLKAEPTARRAERIDKMVTFKIVIHKERHKVQVIEKQLKENARAINNTIYRVLTHYGIGEEIAIDCACWAEYAVVDESYSTEELDVYVI